MGSFIACIFIHYLFCDNEIRINHLNQRNHDGFVDSIIKKSTILITHIAYFYSSKKMRIKAHESVFFELESISESSGFEVKLIDLSAGSQLR